MWLIKIYNPGLFLQGDGKMLAVSLSDIISVQSMWLWGSYLTSLDPDFIICWMKGLNWRISKLAFFYWIYTRCVNYYF